MKDATAVLDASSPTLCEEIHQVLSFVFAASSNIIAPVSNIQADLNLSLWGGDVVLHDLEVVSTILPISLDLNVSIAASFGRSAEGIENPEVGVASHRSHSLTNRH